MAKSNKAKKPVSKKAAPEEPLIKPLEGQPNVWKCITDMVVWRGERKTRGQKILVHPHEESPTLEKYFEKVRTEIISGQSESAELTAEGEK